MTAPNSVLVIRLSSLGDVLFTLPAVHALHLAFPDAAIDWAVEDRAASILDLYPGLRQRLIYPRRTFSAGVRPWRLPAATRAILRHTADLRTERYDLVLDFQGNLKSGTHRLLTRAHRKLGFAASHSKENNHWFPGETVSPGPDAVHRIRKALALVRGAYPQIPPTPPRPPLEIPAESQEHLDALLEVSRGSGVKRVVLHPGTSQFGAYKRWFPDRFGRVGDVLAEEYGVDILVSWGPGEEDLAAAVLASMKSGRGRLAPRTRGLADLAALLRRCDLFIGSDSAPLHMADFLGVPAVALFGPKDPEIYRPSFSPHRVVRTFQHCSPCLRRTCPDVLCMEEITVPQVARAASELLEAAG